MTERKPTPLRLGVVQADDLLLDALGRGEPGPGDDEIAALLAAWRSDLDDLDEPEDLVEPVDPAGPVAPVVPIDRARRPRPSARRVRLVAAAAAVAVVAAGTSVAAVNGTPDSPLWPITRIVNPERAQTVDAQTTLDQARHAIAAGRRDEARRLLDEAAGKIAQVPDPATAARLRTELDSLRRDLAALVSGTVGIPGAVPSLSPVPGGVAPNGVVPSGGSSGGNTGGGTGTGTGSGGGSGSGSGSGSGGGGGGGVPVPTIVPSLPLPTVTPSLPGLPSLPPKK